MADDNGNGGADDKPLTTAEKATLAAAVIAAIPGCPRTCCHGVSVVDTAALLLRNTAIAAAQEMLTAE